MFLCLLASLAVLPAHTQTQDPKALAVLERARATTGLPPTGLPAYRIEASFQTFDQKGALDGAGTVVQSGLPNGRIKRVVTFRGQTTTRLYTSEWQTVTDNGYLETFTQRRLLDGLLGPTPAASTIAKRTIQLRPWSAGAVKLQCAVVSVPVPDERNSHASLPSNVYCADEQNGMLRLIASHGNMNVLLNSFRKFAGVFVAGDVEVRQGVIKRGQLHVEKLEVDPQLKETDLTLPPPGADQIDLLPGDVSPETMQGSIVKKATPKYPDDAKAQHIAGTVTLDAIIGRDGAIRDVEVLTAPMESMANSALEAVKQWRYKPFTANGRPVEVYTTITVNYAFGR